MAGGQSTLEGKAAGIRDVHTERKSRVLLNTHKKKKEKGNRTDIGKIYNGCEDDES